MEWESYSRHPILFLACLLRQTVYNIFMFAKEHVCLIVAQWDFDHCQIQTMNGHLLLLNNLALLYKGNLKRLTI